MHAHRAGLRHAHPTVKPRLVCRAPWPRARCASREDRSPARRVATRGGRCDGPLRRSPPAARDRIRFATARRCRPEYYPPRRFVGSKSGTQLSDAQRNSIVLALDKARSRTLAESGDACAFAAPGAEIRSRHRLLARTPANTAPRPPSSVINCALIYPPKFGPQASHSGAADLMRNRCLPPRAALSSGHAYLHS